MKQSAPIYGLGFPDTLKTFFDQVFIRFGKELELNRKAWFNYTGGEKDLFNQNECTYTGLLNIAISKAYPDAAILLEAAVYNKASAVGRIDCLVRLITGNESVNLIIEAKQWPYNGKVYTSQQTSEMYDKIFLQGNGYYAAEKEYYAGSTYVIAIVFEYLSQQMHVSDMLNDTDDDTITDFFKVYHEDSCGMMVYGKVRQVGTKEEVSAGNRYSI